MRKVRYNHGIRYGVFDAIGIREVFSKFGSYVCLRFGRAEQFISLTLRSGHGPVAHPLDVFHTKGLTIPYLQADKIWWLKAH